jgi:hypothetical protein
MPPKKNLKMVVLDVFLMQLAMKNNIEPYSPMKRRIRVVFSPMSLAMLSILMQFGSTSMTKLFMGEK